MINENRLVEKFIEYVKIDSETLNEKAFADHLYAELDELGFDLFKDEIGQSFGSNGYNIYGYLHGDLDLEPLVLSCHMDTVTPGVGIQPVIRDGAIYSDGTTILGGDDKSGIAAIVEAIKVVQEKKMDHRPLEVVFTIAEEGGLKGSKNFDCSRVKSRKGLVFDSGGDVGAVITKAPAQDKFTFKVIGKAAHAGIAPEEGINAIQVAAEAISNMNLLRIDEETTANIGIIQGGNATNIVTPEVTVIAEARSLKNDKLDIQSKHMMDTFDSAAEKFGAKVEIIMERTNNAFQISDDHDLIGLMASCFDRMGVDMTLKSSGGGSDANNFNEKGIEMINLATGMSKVHTNDEFITIDNLTKVSRLVYEVITMG